MKTGLTFLFLLATSWNVLAENTRFSIQIAASEAPNLAFYKESTGFTSLYAEETSAGLVRIKLGSYINRKEAEKALVKVKSKGFSDAFITAYTGKKSGISSIKPKKSLSIAEHLDEDNVDEEVTINEPQENKLLPPSSSPAWSKLTAEQKRNVVYVDGILHLHEGDEFIPLSSF